MVQREGETGVVNHLEAVSGDAAMSLHTPDKRLEPRGVVSHAGRYPLLADEDLISLVGEGDGSAFGVLYERHSRAVYSVARRLAGEKREAEDLVQEAFVKVWRSAGGYRAERGSVRTWIFSVLRNEAIDRLRSRATRQRALERAEAQRAQEAQPSEAFALAWRSYRWDRAREALQTLPRAQLEVLALVHLCDLTHAETAELLKLPLGTVKGRLRLGLKKLRDHPGLRGMAVE
jgi:RNA polymerase sigma-70 factor (ECF subfamily)